MTDKTQLTTIQFHGASLLVQRGNTPESTFVAMKPVVEGMGLAWQSQHTKLTKHPVLSQGIMGIVIPSAGGDQMMTALPLNRLHFWMATLHPNKIPDPHVREKVIIYQTEAADALFERFFGPALANPISQNKLARQMAAIMDDKLALALSATLPAMMGHILPTAVAGYIAEHNLAIADGVTAGEVCDLAKVAAHYPRGLSGRVSNRLTLFCARNGEKPRVQRMGRVRAQLFPTHLVREWLDIEGRALIQRWIDEKKGQGKLRLIDGGAV